MQALVAAVRVLPPHAYQSTHGMFNTFNVLQLQQLLFHVALGAAALRRGAPSLRQQ
jgi:hypothetical protein